MKQEFYWKEYKAKVVDKALTKYSRDDRDLYHCIVSMDAVISDLKATIDALREMIDWDKIKKNMKKNIKEIL
tara:strand:+ start:5106 stop:5321 length:216 start_codon:yes stop_codon:yes gene_type:complete